MKIQLVGKKALIGGSTSGIGKAIALQLAACGAEVTIVGRNKEKLEDTLGLLDTSKSQRHQYIMTDYMDLERYKKDISLYFERNAVDILVNNTQGPQPGGVLEKSLYDYQQAFDLLFQNAVFTTECALKAMRKQGFGRIINVSSMTVKEPQDTLVLSNTMRTALVSWAKSLANELAKEGITVNSVMTGYFETERLTTLMNKQAEQEGKSFEEIRKGRIASVPVKRLGLPEEYGYLVAFLASEYASYLTGAAIPLDGGIARTIF